MWPFHKALRLRTPLRNVDDLQAVISGSALLILLVFTRTVSCGFTEFNVNGKEYLLSHGMKQFSETERVCATVNATTALFRDNSDILELQRQLRDRSEYDSSIMWVKTRLTYTGSGKFIWVIRSGLF
ncbi:uncharacterized protein LOC118478753 [Aplysia californica]|uniref:Uncharacterized protein LOC118478753 n=1 Tax=Aplysia californica TaxID=6500 RepID=A0ABM1W2B6_APLCA|nr:uncharacterized protein LOC118478753 [Aplysia californica]